jgi:hypothetical protein
MNVVRAMSSEGFGRIKYHTMLRKRMDTDKELRSFFDGETTKIPQFYVDRIKQELGPLFDELPAGAIEHDPNAWLKTQTPDTVVLKAAPGRRANRPAPAESVPVPVSASEA